MAGGVGRHEAHRGGGVGQVGGKVGGVIGGRIGLGSNRAPLRRGAREDARYALPRSLHPGALWLAAGAPLLATLLALTVRSGG
ncbi:hypothetical protein [Methylobacterium sp. A54F]